MDLASCYFFISRENLFEQRLVETAAAIFVRAAFNRDLRNLVFRVSTLYFLAGGARVRVDDDVHRIDAGILQEFSQRYRRGGEIL